MRELVLSLPNHHKVPHANALLSTQMEEDMCNFIIAWDFMKIVVPVSLFKHERLPVRFRDKYFFFPSPTSYVWISCCSRFHRVNPFMEGLKESP